MSIKIDKSGFDKLKQNIDKLAATTEVKLGEMMNPAFIAAHSSFADLDGLVKGAGFKVESIEDFKANPDDEWDIFIKENTDFDSWLDMQQTAHRDYVASIMGAGLKK
ncbi:hypothetical protein HGO40_11175 [Pseudomonas sp. CG7]|uniref:hypothetical protein n=1 Tax=Pseudomonas sp. CG7 TaxID=191007 RepID=UPI002033E007|nr:hypothetical protein [Pseudomonas sp. CG7]MCM2461041.1 hypothetical protein [Pseudomonas sp. CG7]